MNDTEKLTRPEISEFVDQVRARLGDLTEEEREELVGGLEADLSALVADGGSVADLGAPTDYADELRAAAGLAPARRRVRRPRQPLREQLAEELRRAQERWQSFVAQPRVAPVWAAVQPLQPVWWVLRAWITVQLLDLMMGPYEYLTLLPSLGAPLVGPLLLLAAVAGSVQLGRGRLWPADRRTVSASARAVLVGLNVVAVICLVPVLDRFPGAWESHAMANGGGYATPRFQAWSGLVNDHRRVRNVFAYDAQGNPLTGVQLYDQTGRPLAVDPDSFARVRTGTGPGLVYPWLNGTHELWNVFPLPVREQRGWRRPAEVWDAQRPPVLPQPPLAVVPPVALPTPPAERLTESAPSAVPPEPAGSADPQDEPSRTKQGDR